MAEAPTQEAAAELVERLEAEAGISVEPLESAEVTDPAAAAADATAAAEWEAEQDATEEEAEAEAAADAQAESDFDVEAEPQDEEGGAGVFDFDEAGARIGADHSEAATVDASEADPAESPAEPSAKRQRASREVVVTSQQPGTEAGASGERRSDKWGQREPGMFTASNYFWLYYSAKPGLKEVPVGQLAQQGECHATLDEAADIDADSIPGSNSTYEFVGTSVDHPELLHTRIYPCVCQGCVEPDAVSSEYSSCPNMGTVGRFIQQTIHGAVNVVKQRTVQRLKVG